MNFYRFIICLQIAGISMTVGTTAMTVFEMLFQQSIPISRPFILAGCWYMVINHSPVFQELMEKWMKK